MFLWHYEQFVATFVVMLTLLASLIVIYLRTGIGRERVGRAETWFVRRPFSLYLGWITVATIANATVVLTSLEWDQFGLSAETWMVVMLVAVLIIVGLMSITRRDLVYGAVILWALAGIGVKHRGADIVAPATWTTFVLAALLIAGGWIVPVIGRDASSSRPRPPAQRSGG
jgi:hypothetical protein